MEPDVPYYTRRISEELAAADRAVTGAARLRRLQVIEGYLGHLERIGERLPISRDELAVLKAECGLECECRGARMELEIAGSEAAEVSKG